MVHSMLKGLRKALLGCKYQLSLRWQCNRRALMNNVQMMLAKSMKRCLLHKTDAPQ